MLSRLPSKHHFSGIDPDGLTVHRVQAGTANAAGWYEARSTNGHFGVSLPIPFNDCTMRLKGNRGKEADGYIIGALSAEGIKFTATEMVNKKPVDDPKAALEGLLQKCKDDPNRRVTLERSFEFAGRPAVEYKTSDERASAYVRTIASKDRCFLLIVEYPAKSAEEAVSLVKPFFESLKIQATP